MHFPTITFPLLALAAVTPVALAATDAQNAATCQKKFGVSVNNAINEFCSYNNIVVPGAYASNGKWVGKYQVKIQGNCGPPEWVPPYWCGVQMREVCAKAGSTGVADAHFGWAGCQHFVVDNKGFEIED